MSFCQWRTTADGDTDLKKKKEKEDKKKKIKVKEAEDSGNEGLGEWEKVGASAVSGFQIFIQFILFYAYYIFITHIIT